MSEIEYLFWEAVRRDEEYNDAYAEAQKELYSYLNGGFTLAEIEAMVATMPFDEGPFFYKIKDRALEEKYKIVCQSFLRNSHPDWFKERGETAMFGYCSEWIAKQLKPYLEYRKNKEAAIKQDNKKKKKR